MPTSTDSTKDALPKVTFLMVLPYMAMLIYGATSLVVDIAKYGNTLAPPGALDVFLLILFGFLITSDGWKLSGYHHRTVVTRLLRLSILAQIVLILLGIPTAYNLVAIALDVPWIVAGWLLSIDSLPAPANTPTPEKESAAK